MSEPAQVKIKMFGYYEPCDAFNLIENGYATFEKARYEELDSPEPISIKIAEIETIEGENR